MIYSVAALQATTRRVRSTTEARSVMRHNAERFVNLMDWAAAQTDDLRLVVLPEFSLTGTGRKPVDEWTRLLPTLAAEPFEILGAAAQRLGLYVSLATYEYDPDWPGRFWNSALILDPSGDPILRYRKLNDVNHGQTVDTTPGDVWTAYRARYGLAGVYPVVDTPIGRLGCLVCYDVVWPEVARGLTLAGAEVLLHPTNEPHGGSFGGPQTSWDDARLLRAWENQCWLVSANSGETVAPVGDGFSDDPAPLFAPGTAPEMTPLHFSRGFAVIADPAGRAVATAAAPGEAVIHARIDLDTVRRRRAAEPGQPDRLPLERFATTYRLAATCAFPSDHWATTPIADRSEAVATTEAAAARLVASGLVRRPDAGPGHVAIGIVQAALPAADGSNPARALADSLDLVADLVAASPARLIVLPLLFAQGWPASSTVTAAIALDPDDPRLDPIAELCRELDCWLAGGLAIPGVAGPVAAAALWSGAGLQLVQPRLASAPQPFPGAAGDPAAPITVADSPFGRIGLLVGDDIAYPEVARALAWQGAELLLHITAEHHSPDVECLQRARRVRAWESVAALVSVNYGQIDGASAPVFAGPGHSQIVDHQGQIVTVIDAPGAATSWASLDLADQSRRRRGLNMNFLAQLRADVCLPIYDGSLRAATTAPLRHTA